MSLIMRSRRGDTIVEVLLAIAVVGAVLGGAFVAANRSLKASQAARERSEAIRIAEDQIEKLKFINANPAGQNIFQTSLYCITPTLTLQSVSGPNDTACSGGTRYAATIRYVTALQANEITVTWESVGNRTGAATAYDRIQMYYRVHESP